MNEKLARVGHPTQLMAVEEMRLVGGRGDGMRLLQIRNGHGLTLTLQPDRCLDPARMEFKGNNLSFFSPAGYAAPAFYDTEDFLRNFTAGMMTTCGLKNVGIPGEDNGEECVTHGRISNQPCEELTYHADTLGDGTVTVSGVMNEAIIFNEKLQLRRTVTVTPDNTVEFCDTVTNLGGEEQPLTVLYHCNMGYPLLDEDLEMMIPAKTTTPRTPQAAAGMDRWNKFEVPTPAFFEQCFYHELAEKNGEKAVAVYQPKIKTGLRIDYSADTLDYFTEWKMCGVRDYVLGLEPSNAHVDGRAQMRADGRLKILKPMESMTFRVKFSVLDGDDAAAAARKDLMERV